MYRMVKYWNDTYAQGCSDQHAINDFVECETAESVKTLKGELTGMIQGNLNPQALDAAVGKKRLERHGSYIEWAKVMLLWLSTAR